MSMNCLLVVRRRINFVPFLILLPLLFLVPTVNAGSTRWEKLENGVSMIRDLLVRTGHDNNKINKPILQKKQNGGLSLISGGFPRTGTKSIETALSQLGYKVYDSRAMIAHNHFDGWINATLEWKKKKKKNGKSNNEKKDYLRLMTEMVEEIESLGYTTTLDIPMNLLAPALIEVRPDAKVLWNYRSNGFDDWYDSMIFINWFAQPLFYARPFKWIMPNPSEQMKPLVEMLANVYQPTLSYPEHLERILPWYERLTNNQHPMEFDEKLKHQWQIAYTNFPTLLQQTLQKVRTDGKVDDSNKQQYYLEYTIQEGWDPLLNFLLDGNRDDDDDDDVSVTETISVLSQTPFPHVNDRSTLIMISKVLNFIGITFPLWCMLLVYVGFVVVRNTFKIMSKLNDRKPAPKKVTKVE